jgi:hypothetical protein
MARGDYDKAFEIFSDFAYEEVRLVLQARVAFEAADDSQFKDAMDDSVNWLSLLEKDHGDPTEVAGQPW